MARTEAHYLMSATTRGRRTIKGRLYVFVATGDKARLMGTARKIRSEGFNCRLFKSKYYADWELWRSALSNKTYKLRKQQGRV
jgi:hypothetical protein